MTLSIPDVRNSLSGFKRHIVNLQSSITVRIDVKNVDPKNKKTLKIAFFMKK